MTTNDPAIQVRSLGKRYTLGATVSAERTFREAICGTAASLIQGITRRRAASGTEDHAGQAGADTNDFWALRDLNFDLQRGEVLGIIGHNGAGKSTLLKVLSRITDPTCGEVTIHGRVASLLEVGTGFHPELSGRENIYLNGAVLGMRRNEIRSKFDAIVEFSGVERFLDTPVKRYSSGMYVRLAFAVAAHLDPEILIVDEVLAVGDAAFQRKCLGKMGDISRSGRTVLLVSHNMASIGQLCDRALWLDGGQVAGLGPTANVIADYLSSQSSTAGRVTWEDGLARDNVDEIRIHAMTLRAADGSPTATVNSREPLHIELEYEICRPLEQLRLGLILETAAGQPVFETYDADHAALAQPVSPGRYIACCEVPGAFLNEGRFTVTLNAGIRGCKNLATAPRALSFDVVDTGAVGEGRRCGGIRPLLDWQRRAA